MPRSQVALVSGITGQDGSYLAELLLARGYEVHGVVREWPADAPDRFWRIDHLLPRLRLHRVALDDLDAMSALATTVRPSEWYHLAAHSFVSHDPAVEMATLTLNIEATYCALGALRRAVPGCRFYFAASAEMFGRVLECPQNEQTPFHPSSVYGVSKVAGFDLVRSVRDRDGIFAVSGITFNHESPRRGTEFVTRKITRGAALIHAGAANRLELGNLDAFRDWGHARDYVEAMWRMLQSDEPRDYVIATGRSTSVREFARLAFAVLGLDHERWVESTEALRRPADDAMLVGDASAIAKDLGWMATITVEALVNEMVEADVASIAAGAAISR
jgi:GDPmannose 4,6-dehydratase